MEGISSNSSEEKLTESSSIEDKSQFQVQLQVEYLATLTKHMKSVNCVRFSPAGDFLASAGDGIYKSI